MFKKAFIFAALSCLTGSLLFADAGQNVNSGSGQQSGYGYGQAAPSQGKIQWYTDFNQALQVAKQQNKPIVLFFTGSDWCGWCKKINQEVFSSADFASIAGDKFIFVDVDFPRNKQQPQQIMQQNADLKQKYNVTGYPTVIIIDSNQNLLETTGYRPGGGKEYANYLLQFSR